MEARKKGKKIVKTTIIGLYLESFVYGIELTIFEPIEYFYWKNIMVTKSEALLFYSLSLAFSTLASLFSSMVVCCVIKKYQNFRTSFLFLSLLASSGYGLYISRVPYLMVIGKTLAGFSKSTNFISTAYVTKFFSREDTTMKIAILTNIATIGSIVGPLLSYIFVHIDFRISKLRITFENAPGLFLLLLKSILTIFLFFTYRNTLDGNKKVFTLKFFVLLKDFCCCRQPDEWDSEINENYELQELTYHQFDNNSDEMATSRSKHYTSPKLAIKELFQTNVKYVLLIVIYFAMIFKIINSLLPVEASKYLSWRVHSTAAISLGNIVFGTLVSIIIAYYLERINDYTFILTGTMFSSASILLMVTLAYHHTKHGYTLSVVLFTFMSLLNVLSSCLIELATAIIIQRLTILKLIKLTDAIRVLSVELSHFLGTLLLSVVDLNLKISGYIGFSVAVGLTIVLIVKRRILVNDPL